MCNLYRQTTTHEAMRRLFPGREIRVDDSAGNVAPGDVYPEQLAPILTADGSDLILRRARWGLPSPPQYHSKSGVDRGVTNVRNTGSPHWRRWLGPDEMEAWLRAPWSEAKALQRPLDDDDLVLIEDATPPD